jgi:polysaccharide pyruvyl transferase WcaK-like protein
MENSSRPKIFFFGNFGQINFGNEATLQAILYHVRRRLPDAEITCICTDPGVAAKTYNVAAIPIEHRVVRPWTVRHPRVGLAWKVFIGIPGELSAWLQAFIKLKGADALIVPGTGLLSDAFGLFNWGPYNVFKWSLAAKLRRCKLFFVSVGAGPIYGAPGRWLVKSALSLADFRSYRDDETMKFLKSLGVRTDNDHVYPDLAFSLPEVKMPREVPPEGRRRVVGVGVMGYAWKYTSDRPSKAFRQAYLENLVVFVKWLLDHEYDVRLLIGDIWDRPMIQEFKALIKMRSLAYGEGRITDEPVSSVEQLLSQLAATDAVVATRFHGALLPLMLNKPVISISHHQKCASLLSMVGLSRYCLDFNHFDYTGLIERFCDLEKNAEKLKTAIKRKTKEFRLALDEQYGSIFSDFLPE